MSINVVCPSCGVEVPVSDVIEQQVAEKTRQEMSESLLLERKALQTQKLQLQAMEKTLLQTEEDIEARVQQALKSERSQVVAEARKSAREALDIELSDRNEQVSELQKQLEAAQTNELELRRRERQIKEQSEQLEIDVARRLSDGREQIRDEVTRQADEQHRLKVAEKEQLIQQMQKQIDDLRRKSEQGSQQIQGEVLEVELEETLAEAFPVDQIVAVPKGQNGGDVVQSVISITGRLCGTILWESKRTKNFSRQWLPKLRDDQRKSGAHCAVIVTEALPEGVKTATQVDGIWICSRAYALAVGMALRAGIIEVAKARNSAEGRHEKSDRAYNYLCSPEFTHHLSGVVEAFTEMLKDLDSEERSAKTRFRKRRKQLDRAFTGTSGMYGDLQGMIGNAMPEIQSLEFHEVDTGEVSRDMAS